MHFNLYFFVISLLIVFINVVQCNTDEGNCTDLTYYWIAITNEYEIPNNAIVGGYETNVTVSYVGHIKNYKSSNGTYSYLPAKVTKLKTGYAGVNGIEITSKTVEVLCGEGVQWQFVNQYTKKIPTNAIVGGTNPKGNPLYIGRRQYQCNVVLIGWISQTNMELTVSYNGNVTIYKPEQKYQILVASPSLPTYN